MDGMELHDLNSVRTHCPQVWVKNRAVKAYLDEIWRTSAVPFCIHVSGSDSATKALLGKRMETYDCWGFVDTGYEESNFLRWKEEIFRVPVIMPPVHQMENYFLDWNGLESSPLNIRYSKASEIKKTAEQIAEGLIWWMVTRALIQEQVYRLTEKLPPNPPVELVYDLRTTEEYLTENEWFRTIGETASSLKLWLSRRIHANYHLFREWFESGEWERRYCGTAVLEQLIPAICPVQYANQVEIEVDFARSVGRYQSSKGKVPLELVGLPLLFAQAGMAGESPRS